MYEYSDEKIIESLKNGDDHALTLLFKKYWTSLFVVAHNVFKDKEACEDILQEVFLTIWEKRNELQIKTSLKAYLYACVKYEVYRQLKKSYSKQRIDDDLINSLEESATANNIEYKQLVETVSFAVDNLPPKCREVYQLSRQESLTHKAIASKMNISTKTVENHITKALKHLKLNIQTLFL
ncbi:RNA polymerase, sigma-24 subunit, ECF subfamily [Pseudopedobacter saltans DSM 12145]|uniref:RNA polymerase, sigma-24 subunit, ECF subfamily n=1 Tax=Pseudopedobacter saltans (strain ATCC 51119 / DSM 12145 / JCM 21818 / CCUG 39354 / LMG 10337 / NBRC 100064 / NCIMB 13643) TaxID=762903 RepID=F0SB83_PSESL|nr:RNA polymerase sigma-70 factor [Pseudopedobacter saltans]ADY53710.1 RNA polymerase, sigma-24 subunit, ECF subfamily [Pseudopedobacter saltans DSM 12145]